MNAAGQNASNPFTYPSRNYTALVAKISATTAVPGSNCTGWVWFRTSPDDPTTTQVYANLTGVFPPDALHGFHVHTYGDWSAPTGSNAGGHWNPLGYTHALPTQANTRHAGDLGNIRSDAYGVFNGLLTTLIMPISGIVGRGVVLHQDPDQGNVNSDTGLSGARLGMGVIGFTNQIWPLTPVVVDTSSSTGGDACLTTDGNTCNAASHAHASSFVATAAAALLCIAALRRV